MRVHHMWVLWMRLRGMLLLLWLRGHVRVERGAVVD